MATFGGSCDGSGDRVGRIVLREFRSEVDGEDGGLGWSGSRELFYGTDVIVSCLKKREETQAPSELWGRVGLCVGVYLWRWLVNLKFFEVQILDEVYAGKLSIWMVSGRFWAKDRPFRRTEEDDRNLAGLEAVRV